MTTSTNKPVSKLRDGSLSVAIWRNDSKNGNFYTVKFARSYKDEQGEYHDTDSFNGYDLLQISRLVDKAYEKIAVFRRADQSSQS